VIKTTKSGLPIQGVRSRMLLIVAVLSLPLLIISLLQLNYYRSSLNARTALIAGAEADAGAATLSSWLNEHPVYANQSSSLSYDDGLDLFRRLDQQTTHRLDVEVTVFDGSGRAIGNPLKAGATPGAKSLSDSVQRERWSDGNLRMTSVKFIHPLGWSVVVGVPLDGTYLCRVLVSRAGSNMGLSAVVINSPWGLGC
jgi:hypothetical protein